MLTICVGRSGVPSITIKERLSEVLSSTTRKSKREVIRAVAKRRLKAKEEGSERV